MMKNLEKSDDYYLKTLVITRSDNVQNTFMYPKFCKKGSWNGIILNWYIKGVQE